ncbi:hypothetical protein F383_13437 [Gossypium arboreum]|uniref:Uncharacterized protein n=1 Tax=Gossypium arboreum TaxID=29729 RepID=A0A0B0N7R1_GOSAR|nr:hypothetical protein F383_13437 [Gossypium arboreum]
MKAWLYTAHSRVVVQM